jgi:hypothetical protein
MWWVAQWNGLFVGRVGLEPAAKGLCALGLNAVRPRVISRSSPSAVRRIPSWIVCLSSALVTSLSNPTRPDHIPRE